MPPNNDDLVSRKDAARILGLSIEGVRKYEGRKLTPIKRGVAVYFDRGEVEALRSQRGTTILAPTKAEREYEKMSAWADREDAREARARARAAKTDASEGAATTRMLAKLAAETRALEEQEASRRAKEEALRAASVDWVARTVNANGAAQLLDATTYEVARYAKSGALPQAVPSPALIERFGEYEWTAAVRRAASYSYGPRYDRETVQTLAMVVRRSPSATRKLERANDDDFGAKLASSILKLLPR